MITLQFSGNATTGQVKEITHAGRRYLVSPVVALREGILNDTYVSAAEFSKFASSWQGRPVPISHPRADGLPTSANTPDIWANDVLGHLWNVAVDGGALKGEIWIDLDKAQTMGERAVQIVNKLRANQPMEVSTGYFCEMEATAGSYNGAAYGGIARNIRPDHLAILPDEAGACSWADGCGTPRVNTGGKMQDEQGLFERFLSWFAQRKVSELIVSPRPEGSRPAGLATNLIVNEAAPPCAEETKQENEMGKEQLIAGLVANAKCKFSKEKLQTWAEGDLQVLQESLGTEETEEVAAPEVVPVHKINRPEAGLGISPEVDARFAAIESLLKGLTANSDREKAELVAAIVANAHGAWSEADLMRHDLPKLQTVYSSYLPRDYSANAGAGALWARVNGPEEETMLMPWPDEFKKLGV